MTEKEKNMRFCEENYVPIYSQPWWLDAICGIENWNAKVFEIDGNVMGAMAYYTEFRGKYKYITKIPLTQNNGVIFKVPNTINQSSIPSFEEKVINLACDFIESLNIDVYEQQYVNSFTNWSPFYWRGYEAVPRYSYFFSCEELKDLDKIWGNMDKKKRREIKKGESNCSIEVNTLSAKEFYEEVKKVYSKQNIQCPFTFELFERLYNSTIKHNSGYILAARDNDGIITSTKFLVWDKKTTYALISGGDVKYQPLETKSALDWKAISDAAEKGLNYDFEGSMIARIAKAYRRFGSTPRLYFRIRKIFNPEIIRQEADEKIMKMKISGGGVHIKCITPKKG